MRYAALTGSAAGRGATQTLPGHAKEREIRLMPVFNAQVRKNLEIFGGSNLPICIGPKINIDSATDGVSGSLKQTLNPGEAIKSTDVALYLVTDEHPFPQRGDVCHRPTSNGRNCDPPYIRL